MRVQCDVCEKRLAQVLCCADQAALCGECDSAVHAANKLANKHQRVQVLQGPEQAVGERPVCDICQEKVSFFFCLEDRAVLCRNCDLAIHLPCTLSAGHRRFLFTNTRVALEPYDPAPGDAAGMPEPSAGPADVAAAAGPLRGGGGGGDGGSSSRVGAAVGLRQGTAAAGLKRRVTEPLPRAGTGGAPREASQLPAVQERLRGESPEGLSPDFLGSAASLLTAAAHPMSSSVQEAAEPLLRGLSEGLGGPGPAAGGAIRPTRQALANGSLNAHMSGGFSGFAVGVDPTGGLMADSLAVSDAMGAHALACARASMAGVGGMPVKLRGGDGPFDLESLPGWRVDELLNIPDLADGYSLADVASSKAEAANLGDFDWTADLSLFDEQVYAESLHEVPQMAEAGPSAPAFLAPEPGAGPSSLGALGASLGMLPAAGAVADGLGGSLGSARAGPPSRLQPTSLGAARTRASPALAPDFDDAFVVPDVAASAKRRRAVT